ncbi:hypothetical protein DB30_06890 [Enhygromyxa salina]|uniref:Uncharacterized protein n=1 Tax=Enhygromyxa salina TaxID=215803 RepID=A0A0C1ZTC4_9BACT|nr:hypothetical protein [Enhygromyxa salina]KIG14288.1 hypothetical protein DB30_06890 [Enhygromyxa salina]
MRWFLDIFTRDADPEPQAISAAGEVGGRIDITGIVEAIEASNDLKSPLDGSPAVALHYVAHIRAVGQHTEEIDGLVIQGSEGRDFILRDDSGAALIQLEPGSSVARLHAHVITTHGAGNEINVEAIVPGDRVRVRGRIRAVLDEAEARWCCVVQANELEHAQ